MPSGTAAGADKPITPLVLETLSRTSRPRHEEIRSGYLQEESIHEVLGIVAQPSKFFGEFRAVLLVSLAHIVPSD